MNYPYGEIRTLPAAGSTIPRWDLANSYRLNANGLPFLDGTFNSNINELTDVDVVERQASNFDSTRC
ncbi:MAG: hypothetical protein WDO15_09550 [Bacteroidota bacterium]